MAEYFKNFTKKLVEWQIKRELPSASDFPTEILFDEILKAQCKLLEGYTKERSGGFFRRNEGSTGYEYSVTGIHFLDELYFTKAVPGDWDSVMPAVKITDIKTNNADPKNISFSFKVSDGRNISEIKTKGYSSEILSKKPKEEMQLRIVSVLHSHPKSRLPDGVEIYTFFSTPDLFFLSSMPLIFLGMVSQNNLWLMVRTRNFTTINTQALHAVTLAERYAVSRKLAGESVDIIEEMKKSIRENLADSGLVFYQGSFGSLLRKI